MKHRFRCFVPGSFRVGDAVELEPDDAKHLGVVRTKAGDLVDVVDADRDLFVGVVSADRRTVVLDRQLDAGPRPWPVRLVAEVGDGGAFDELVDLAVQAGASEVVPYAPTGRQAAQAARRAERAQRVALAAAKQSQRLHVPPVLPHVGRTGLLALGPGLVCDGGATTDVAEAATAAHDRVQLGGAAPVTVLVGASFGLDPALVTDLVGAGWSRVGLGPTVLRAQLAGAVAVSSVVRALR